LAGQPPQQPQQLQVILFFIVEPVAPLGAARRVQVRRIAVHKFPALIRKVRQESVRAPVHQLHRVLALESLQGTLVEVDTDVAQRRGLALHDRTAPEVTLDIRCRAGASAR